MTTIFWYDYEATGIHPRSDRPLQVAGIRTDLELNEVDKPVNLYCLPSDDILPHPAACMITGITPGMLAKNGLTEADFMTRVYAELAAPGTCSAGYNNLRFDDEMTRHSLYRNFFDPYTREWRCGNSRWDLINVVRTAYALRPEGIVWPQQDGRVTFKLERLTKANGIDHGQAHDALLDVRATIAMARLIRKKQPKLYEWLFQLRSKHRVMDQVHLLRPVVYISRYFSAERYYFGVVLPLAWHPHNRNALIVCDLGLDPQVLLDLDAKTLRKRLYTRRKDLAEGELPVPLKLLHINRCPVLAPLNVLWANDCRRIQFDIDACQALVLRLNDTQEVWLDKLTAIYAEEACVSSADPEQQLYNGFISNHDRRLCEQLRVAEPSQLASKQWSFDDYRLLELLFRYRARNFPDSLNSEERDRWKLFCQQRLTHVELGAPNTLLSFKRTCKELSVNATPLQCQVLDEWQMHADCLTTRLDLQSSI
ncbi:exodeoxyribonuclease I [Candidatus Pseudomonas adelgestsugas]|uniref:Exodeoxyribonuclease I n=1 Tax=Candidatus Pseudomonas adelgestsugas TaxID=1302376 RepID=A0ABX5R997_9PSED|nr:exodeoxyribonuclease I [Candidatus Pseudomonas adelgestsugas]QAX82227.1 Exodeoxyribonuclease I [Candidatus Pseudomonas adelgestsugas]